MAASRIDPHATLRPLPVALALALAYPHGKVGPTQTEAYRQSQESIARCAGYARWWRDYAPGTEPAGTPAAGVRVTDWPRAT